MLATLPHLGLKRRKRFYQMCDEFAQCDWLFRLSRDFAARKAILQYYQTKGLLEAVDVADVYLGNGVSELIVMTMQALLDDGDEVLIQCLTTRFGQRRRNLAGVKRFIICVMKPTTGSQILPISKAKSMSAPKALWSSTQTTQQARFILPKI